jgi:hypothetical protein
VVYSIMASYTTPPIPVTAPRSDGRADFIFAGVEQAGPSFEGRVFLNNPEPDEGTALTPDWGDAGSFHVYGYGQPLPPAIAEAKAGQARDGGAVAPITKRLHADEEAVRAALDGSDELTVTVIPVPADPGGTAPERPFEHVDIVFDRGTIES